MGNSWVLTLCAAERKHFLAGKVGAYYAEIGRNAVSEHQIQLEYGDEQVDAGRDCRTRLTRPNTQARTGTGKNNFAVQLIWME